MEIKPTSYKLENCATGRQFQDATGWMLADPEHKDPALVRAVYEKKQIEFKDNSYGIYKFADWMPIQRMLEGSCAPVTYKSEALAKELAGTALYHASDELSGYVTGQIIKVDGGWTVGLNFE